MTRAKQDQGSGGIWADRPLPKSLSGVMAAVACLYSVFRYSDLPDRIPVHWGPGGLGNEVERLTGGFLIPGIVLALWLLALQVDRALRGQPRVQKAHLIAVNAFAGLLLLFHVRLLHANVEPESTSLGMASVPNPFGSGVASAFTFFVLLGLLLIAAALPMALSIVPPNKWYGFRTGRTLEDRKEWYRVNRRSGVLFGAVGGILIATAAILYLVAELSPGAYAYICMGVVVGGLILAAVIAPRGDQAAAG